MENDRVCTFKFKDQSRSTLSLLRHKLSVPALLPLKQYQCSEFILSRTSFTVLHVPRSFLSSRMQSKVKNPRYTLPASLVTH